MKRYIFILVALFSLILATLACSVFSGGKDETAVPTTVPPTAVPTAIPQPAATATPEFEESTIDRDSLWNTAEIKSYRGEFTVTFEGTSEGTAVNGSITMNIESTSDPAAQHVSMNIAGYDLDPELAGITTIEFYIMEGMAYMNMGGLGGWMSFPNDPEESISNEFLNFNEFVDFPEKAKRKLLPENVNGVMAWHYVVDKEDLEEGLGIVYDEASADAWIAVDGGYLVKMDVTMSGNFTSEDLGDQPIDQGTMNVVFNMHDVNETFTIELPPEAASAEPFTFDFGTGGEWTREDAPLPPDAEISFVMEGMVSAFTSLTYDETLEFMLTQLEANGWVVEGDPVVSEGSYWANFLKEGESLFLMIDPATDGTDRFSISITIGSE